MDSRFTLALKYYDTQLYDEAWAALREAANEAAAGADVLRLAIVLRLHAEAFGEVLGFCDRLIALMPQDADAWASKALASHRLTRLIDAEHSFRAALALRQTNPAVWNNLGNLLDDLGRPDEAVAAFERALSIDPHFSAAHNNLGATLAGQGRFAAAALAHERALAADANNVAAQVNLGVALLEQARMQEAIAAFDRALGLEPGNADAADNRLYARLYIESDPKAVLAEHAAWGTRQPQARRMLPAEPSPERRLRIGYVSPDFRRHSVSFFVEPLLRAHDPRAVEVFCYADVMRADEVTARLKAAAHHWRDTQALSHDALAQRIAADGIDILVDLAGHTKGNRLPVFARRAAPVQISALGYPATTGLPAMDFRLCDMVTDPAPHADLYATETLVRLDTGLHCYAPPSAAPAPGALPVLSTGHVTFGSFNKLAKLSPPTIAAWSSVLKAVPGSRLILKSKPLAEQETCVHIAGLFAAHGIDRSRLELLGWAGSDAAHLALYHRVDIALDTFPYNGTTTTCEALWMGVPVVTLAGPSHAARVGASLLSTVGLRECIAHNESEFVACASALSKDTEGLTHLRAGLRALVSASPLCDGAGYARAVEAAYRVLWRRACAF